MHWRRKRHPTPVFLPGESQGRGSLAGCRLWGRTELDTTEATWQQRGLLRWLIGKEYTCNAGDAGLIPGSGGSPGEGTAAHSSILAWKILWTEESGGLQSRGHKESDMT